LDPVILAFFASYYTETLLYSNFCGRLFSRTCQAREKTGFTVISQTKAKVAHMPILSQKNIYGFIQRLKL